MAILQRARRLKIPAAHSTPAFATKEKIKLLARGATPKKILNIAATVAALINF
jgi:hypothetical protein